MSILWRRRIRNSKQKSWAGRCFLTTLQNTPRCSGVRDRKSELLRLTFEEGHRGFFAGVQHGVVILCPKFGHSFDGKEGNKVHLLPFTAFQRFERELEKIWSRCTGATHTKLTGSCWKSQQKWKKKVPIYLPIDWFVFHWETKMTLSGPLIAQRSSVSSNTPLKWKHGP